ncbi:MAG TPA: hypothetical protein PKJ34_12190 [Anaerolineaceae bacterium]|nr:hypothetical protein [Anaerolineaceae bacterium]HOH20990.1 hypothetical protein [Anaerolineaceae bacterium]
MKIIQNQKTNCILIFLTVTLYVLPIYVDLLVNGWVRTFSYFAADTFYYLTVARNFSDLGIFSFDGEYITNGFHPLWQVITGYLYRFMSAGHVSEAVYLVAVLTLSVILISLTIVLLGWAYKNWFGEVPSWFLFLPIGVYALMMSPILHRYGTLWSFSNGMESAPLLLMYALLTWSMSRPGWLKSCRSSILTGLILGVMTLARLDHGLIIPALFLMVLFRIILERNFVDIKWLVLAGGISSLVIFGYLLANQATLGVWLPVSGVEKSTFPYMLQGSQKIEEIRKYLQEIGQPAFGLNIWRYTQIIFPVLIALPVFVAQVWRGIRFRRLDDESLVWSGTSLFVILLASYNFFYVPTLDQGHWYFPISILFMSMWVIKLASHIRINPGWIKLAVPILLLAFNAWFYMCIYHDPTLNARNVWFFQEASNLKSHYQGRDVRLLEYDDGIIAYTTGFNAMSALGFCLDPQAQQALHDKTLFDLAYDRGYRYIASHYYFRYSNLGRESTPEEIKTFLSNFSWIGPKEVDGFRFWIDYASDDNQFVMIGFERLP